MFLLDRTARNYWINFWLDQPQHFTVFNFTVMGLSFLSMFILADIGVGFTLFGFAFIIHFPKFRKQFDHYQEVQKQEAERLAKPQVRALKKKRSKKR